MYRFSIWLRSGRPSLPILVICRSQNLTKNELFLPLTELKNIEVSIFIGKIYNLKTHSTNSNQAKHFVNSAIDNLELFTGSFTTYQFKPHFHDSYTIIFLDLGVGDYSYSDNDQIIETGGMLVLNPYDVHTGRSVEGYPWHFSSMYISQKIMQQAMSSMGIHHSLPIFKNNIITDHRIFQKGHKAYPDLIYGKNTLASEKLLMKFLRALIEKYGSLNGRQETVNGGRDKKPVEGVRDYIHEHFLSDLSVKQLAQQVNMTEYNLVRHFKKAYHLPPRQYLLNLRIEKAKKLLAQRLSSTQVAYQTGFFDQSHFIRHFKRFIGVTPRQFASKVG